MRLYFYAEITLLSDRIDDASSSPEEFLSTLEDALERGDLTIDEVKQILNDHNTRQR